MNIVQLVLAAIGAVCVFGFLCFAIGALWLAWQVHKCERDEARAWRQETILRERICATTEDDDTTRAYPPGERP